MEWAFLWLGISLGALMHRLLTLRKLNAFEKQSSILLKKASAAIKESDELTAKSKQTLKKIQTMYDCSNN